jgi:acylphosphatase
MTESAKSENRICVRCTVAGLVQGVFFRASAREEALRLGVSGHARNLPDGRVEVLACGEPEAVNQMREWLRRGPPQAQVTGLACEAVEPQPLSGFSTI